MLKAKKTIKTYKTIPVSEFTECIHLVDYLNDLKKQGKLVAFSHIPNSTYTASWSAKRMNKDLFVAKGVPDYLLVFPHHIAFLEMKSLIGYASKDQKEWIAQLKSAGVSAFVARGFLEARALIENELCRG